MLNKKHRHESQFWRSGKQLGLGSLLLIMALSGCRPTSEDGAVPQGGGFFDLREYFRQESRRLQEMQPEGMKTVRLDGQTARQALAQMNYEAELAPFSASDINKPSWKDKYQVDSLLEGRYLREIVYTAKDPALKTREMRIRFENDRIGEVRIRNAIRSIISESEQELRYDPDNGYTIKGMQGGKFARKKEFSVEVLFGPTRK